MSQAEPEGADRPAASIPDGLVLVVDDEDSIRQLYQAALTHAGCRVLLAANTAQARAQLETPDGQAVDAVILDVMMPGESGLDLLGELQTARPRLPIIMSTASSQVSHAVTALKSGAYDYLVKPTPLSELLLVVRNAVERGHMQREINARRALDGQVTTGAGGSVFESPAMRALLGMVELVKDANVPVLIQGETGSGKEVIARTLHERSVRHRAPFVAVNCAALPRDLAESELFGHERGAFTGANVRRVGRFEEARDGTVFLDEVGELEQGVQAKLLRVLQERQVTRVGGGTVAVHARVVVATHRDLRAMVNTGAFREDLYYRLEVIQLRVPPLRERREEIPRLAQALLDRFAQAENLGPCTLTPAAGELLQRCTWPGNVRELENVLKRSLLVTRQPRLDAAQLLLEAGPPPPPPVHQGAPAHPVAAEEDEVDPPVNAQVPTLAAQEAQLMLRALAGTHGNVALAARRLGIGRATFYRRARRHHIVL